MMHLLVSSFPPRPPLTCLCRCPQVLVRRQGFRADRDRGEVVEALLVTRRVTLQVVALLHFYEQRRVGAPSLHYIATLL
jgi:hypothetical protein